MNEQVTVPLAAPLYPSRFIERPNKYLIRCAMETNEVVEAHLADPGRLKGILIPGCTVWLRPASGEKRKTKWSAVLSQPTDEGVLVSLDSTLANRLIGKALAQNALGELAGWSLVQAEYKHGHSRWDFFLTRDDGQCLFLEVKSVTLAEDGVGMFPDAVTARGTRHLQELAALVGENDTQAAVLFVAQRQDVEIIKPAWAIDPKFAEALVQASAAGVRILGRKVTVTTSGVSLSDRVPIDLGKESSNVQF